MEMRTVGLPGQVMKFGEEDIGEFWQNVRRASKKNEILFHPDVRVNESRRTID